MRTVAGEPVAVIVAETRDQALSAAEAVAVDYEPLPAATTIEAALAEDPPRLWPDRADNRSLDWQAGDAEGTARALEAADHLVELEVESPRALVAFMEPRGALASFDPDGA